MKTEKSQFDMLYDIIKQLPTDSLNYILTAIKQFFCRHVIIIEKGRFHFVFGHGYYTKKHVCKKCRLIKYYSHLQ